jgi:3'-phosphoadenosine 5'-phosphosulfate sulfotransferase (PAPS reductase)/FAD synthetase
MIICWWSGGITSAVACKIAIDSTQAIPVYIETGSHHDDTLRFKADCEKWYGKPIETIQSEKYGNHFDVIEKRRFINGPAGALCTSELKRMIREKWQKGKDIKGYVWGFEYTTREAGRADRIKTAMPTYQHIFPLIEAQLTKPDCIELVTQQGIEVPAMYKLGFHNNNCIGCVKGGMAYWNKIREHFPKVFERMAKAEREIGRSCIRKYYLDELPLDAGHNQPPLVGECGATGEGCITSLSRDFYNRD